jgi:RHS repeat-associated protein
MHTGEAKPRRGPRPRGAGDHGSITISNADWRTLPAGTQPLVNNLYQGMTLDAVTGLYDEWARDYAPSLGRWMEQDPAQYINGANTYQFVDSSPVGNVDAKGLWYKMSGSEMDSLANDVEIELSTENTGYEGWTKDGAAVFVSYEFLRHATADEMITMGVNLFTSPIGAATGGLQPSLKKVAKGVAKHTLAGAWANLHVHHPAGGEETEVWYWVGKVRNKTTGCMRTITANLFIIYNESTETFNGIIDGSVGMLGHSDGEPRASSVFHIFNYPFSGAIKLVPKYFVIPWFNIGVQFGDIKPGSWRY